MPGYSTAAKDEMLNRLAALANWVSLHASDPGNTGTAEIAGVPYQRQPIEWNSSVLGVVTQRVSPVFFLASGTAFSFIGLWTQQVGGVYLGSGQVTPQSFSTAGQYVLTGITLDLALVPLLV